MGSYKWVIIGATMVITPIRGLMTLFITTHEPPSTRVEKFRGLGGGFHRKAQTPPWEFPKIRDTLFWGPCNKDPTI